MQLKTLFENETSRANTDFVLGIILQKPALLKELVDLVFLKEEPASRRAIWVLDVCDEQHPDLVRPFLETVIKNLSLEDHDAYKRHSLRILSRHEIAEKQEVFVFEFCLNILLRNEATAIKLFAIHILYRFTQKEPELKHEVIAAIEIGIREGSVGLKNIGNKTLKKLKKI
jgi:hypothetical protein